MIGETEKFNLSLMTYYNTALTVFRVLKVLHIYINHLKVERESERKMGQNV